MLGGLPRDEAGQSVVFDGEGNRISQSLNDCLTTRFVYDGADVVMELSANNEVIWAWVNAPGLDQPVERIAFINGTPRQRQVFHADGLGSIAALTDESGATIQTYAYEAFGSIRTQAGTDLNRVTYTAREALGDSLELYYYRNRVLDPTTGRFTSEDPLGFVDGANRYVYCANNPMLFVDPFGREADELCQLFRAFKATAQSGELASLVPKLPGHHPIVDISMPPLTLHYDPWGFDGSQAIFFVLSLTYELCGFEYTIPSYEDFRPLGPKGSHRYSYEFSH